MEAVGVSNTSLCGSLMARHGFRVVCWTPKSAAKAQVLYIFDLAYITSTNEVRS